MNGTYTAVVDRVVDDTTAVILLEDDGDVVEELTVPLGELPDGGQEGGAVLRVTVSDGQYVDAEYLAEETRTRRESAAERLDRLSERLSDRES